MPNLKDVKDRISSINSTQKITRAMKMVAAAKVKKAENLAKSGRPFVQALHEMFSRALASVGAYGDRDLKVTKPIDNYPVLLAQRELKSAGYLLITSNKGLAGAYNANLVRFFLKKVEQDVAQGIKVKVFIVGQKGFAALHRRAKDYGFEIEKVYNQFPQMPTAIDASVVCDDLAQSFVDGEIDSIEVITTLFKNMMSYKVGIWKLLPVEPELKLALNTEAQHYDFEMLFEPGADAILQKLVPLYLTNLLYHALLEATASELASRMTAMSSATKNAQDMIRDLTVVYNKARQGAITQEISEVVSGADALRT